MNKTIKLFRKIAFIALVFTLIFSFDNITAQVNQQWVKRFNGTGNNSDYAYKTAVDKFSGDIYVIGSSYSSVGSFDIVTIKYNSAGSQQWIKTYNGTGNGSDNPIDMIVDNFGNVIITGTSPGLNSGPDCITIKYDKYGNTLWIKRYNGTGNSYDYGMALAQDSQGSVVITGKSVGNISGINTSDDIITIKYDYFGFQEWVQRFNGVNNLQDVGNSVVTDNSGNIYVAGTTTATNNFGDFITIKYSPQGAVEWIRKVESGSNDYAYRILQNYQSEQVFITGKSGSNTVIYCYDYAGSLIWQNSDYGALSSFASAAIDNAGNILICGNTYTGGTSDYAVVKYNSVGGLAGFITYNGSGSGYDFPKDIAIDNSNNFYLTGYSQGAGSGYDYTTVKFGSNGTLQWEKRYNFTGVNGNYASSIALDNNGNVFVTGYSQNSLGNYDYATIKYTQGLVLKRPVSEIPEQFKLYQNYPNPFNPSTSIKFDLPDAGYVKIAVYDMIGKEIRILAEEYKEAGSYEISVDASNLASGMYFYKLTSGRFTDIKKMLLVK